LGILRSQSEVYGGGEFCPLGGIIVQGRETKIGSGLTTKVAKTLRNCTRFYRTGEGSQIREEREKIN